MHPAINVEGIFRISGSDERIKDLRNIFESPDRYGKGLDWTGYAVHDAANILLRYLEELPEPVIPLEFYDRFREPLQDGKVSKLYRTFDSSAAIKKYQQFIGDLRPLHRQLLLYLLDTLAVFVSKSSSNLLTTSLAAMTFQRALLYHPAHADSLVNNVISQDVLIFLVENQDQFLIGMENTVKNT
jgi:GTPase-activating protein SAC7